MYLCVHYIPLILLKGGHLVAGKSQLSSSNRYKFHPTIVHGFKDGCPFSIVYNLHIFEKIVINLITDFFYYLIEIRIPKKEINTPTPFPPPH